MISFSGELQQTCHTPEAALALAGRRPASPMETARLLTRLVSLTPRERLTEVSGDERLAERLRALKFELLKPDELAQLIWACAMLRRPLRASEIPSADLVALLDMHATNLDVHVAAQAAWAWESLVRDAQAFNEPLPARLLERTASLPFIVHLGLIDPSLVELESLRTEAAPQRDEIRSGSKHPGKAIVTEKRLTAWQSEENVSFAYSGKEMMPQMGSGGHGPGFTPRIRAVRDVLARTLDRRYDSVLINYYEDGSSSMNYHADPDQGERWGYSTCVVSAGDARLFVFRRIGAPAQRCTFALRSGDVVEMFGNCQAHYQHSIRTEAEAMRVGPRMSLVYKRTMATETCAASHERPDGRLQATLRTMSPRLGVGRARVTLNSGLGVT